MECCYLAEAISISPNPGIKCYAGNNGLCVTPLNNTVKTTRVSLKLTDEDLWTGESVYCICLHHVEQHCTIRDENGPETTIHCHGSDEHCNCDEFRTCSIKLSLSNCYKMVTEV